MPDVAELDGGPGGAVAVIVMRPEPAGGVGGVLLCQSILWGLAAVCRL